MKCTGLKAVSYPDTRMIIKGSTVQFGTNTRIFYIVCYRQYFINYGKFHALQALQPQNR